MNKGIAHYLMLALVGLPGVSLFGGLVSIQEQVQPSTDDSENPRSTTLRYPVTADFSPCSVEKPDLRSMIPSGQETGILYFEGSGTTSKGRAGRFFNYESRLRLIIWLDTDRIAAEPGPAQCSPEVSAFELPTLLLNEVVRRLDGLRYTRVSNFGYLQVDVSQVFDSTYNLFSAYTLDAKSSQYLMPPYQAMGIDLVVSYSMHQNCIQNLIPTDPESC